jgi:hypothetical protein
LLPFVYVVLASNTNKATYLLPANAKVIKYGFISYNKVHRHHLHLHIHFKEIKASKQNYTEDEKKLKF